MNDQYHQNIRKFRVTSDAAWGNAENHLASTAYNRGIKTGYSAIYFYIC
ncbi:hypothetical protein SXCC_01862 [Gluconacetobacter sp. SXCC-1]|nr:hypothetical protein SXCC_01862 [Gluconacetobacter sp. SXCC-1]